VSQTAAGHIRKFAKLVIYNARISTKVPVSDAPTKGPKSSGNSILHFPFNGNLPWPAQASG
jgi:hypothetical protein